MKNKYDVVIIGAGLSGFCAAVEGIDSGLSVLLLEKGKSTGGSGNYVEGVFAVDSELQKKRNITINKNEVLKEEMNYSHYQANHDMWKKYINRSSENITWLQNHGVEFDQVASLGTGINTWHLFKSLGYNAIHSGLEPYAKSRGVVIKTLTEAIDVHKKNNHGYEITYRNLAANVEEKVVTSNLIFATGGYINNDELIKETLFKTKTNIVPMNSGKSTGDGLKMAWSLGAQKYFTGMKMKFGAQLVDSKIPPYKLWESNLGGLVISAQPCLWVNENGDRFIDENHGVDDWASQGNAISRQEKTFVILDQKIIDYLTDVSIIKDMHPFYTKPTIPNLRAEINGYVKVKAQFMNIAGSIYDLQEKIKANNLVKTINRYNELATKKKDLDFGKPAKYLYSLERKPFYAVEVACGAYTTGDGLKVNLENQVLDENGMAIDGVYAIGSDGSGIMYGDTYGVEVPGSHAGYCVFSGRNAIKSLLLNK